MNQTNYPATENIGRNSIVDMLRNIESLSHLQESTLERIGRDASLQKLKNEFHRRKNIIYSQGDIADKVYLIVDGRVDLYQHSKDGNSRMTDIAIKGNWLGLQEVFCGENPHPYFNEAIVRQDSKFIVFPTYNIIDLFGQIPEFGQAITRELARGYIPLYLRLHIFSLRSTIDCLLDFFMEYGPSIGTSYNNSGGFCIEITEEEIGQLIGKSREHVSRYIKKFKTLGLIDTKSGNGKIYIPDFKALVDYKK